jgi:hypothetical protein
VATDRRLRLASPNVAETSTAAGREPGKDLVGWSTQDVGIVEVTGEKHIEPVVGKRQDDQKNACESLGSHSLSPNVDVVLPITSKVAVVEHGMVHQVTESAREASCFSGTWTHRAPRPSRAYPK